MPECYSYQIRFGGRERFILWFDDEPDGVLLDRAGMLACFWSDAEARRHAEAEGHPVKPASASLDLDAVAAWCEHPGAGDINCSLVLDAWNLFTDVAASAHRSGFIGADERYRPVYDKLFYGCNLTAITPPGQRYVPIWTDADVHALTSILSSGLEDFRNRLG